MNLAQTTLPPLPFKSSILNEFFHIRKIEIRCIAPITYAQPFYDATMGPFHSYQTCFVRLTDAEGSIGECEYPSSAVRYLQDFFAPILLNSTDNYEKIYRRLFWSIRNEGFRGSAAQALGHLDRVFYDLAATRKDLPLYQYLGATTNKVKAYASGGGINIVGTELIDECLSWEAEGYKTIKIKFGGLESSLVDDIQRIQSVREALQPKTQLAVDANQSLTLLKAKMLVKELEYLNIAWLEEPVLAASIHEISNLCESSKLKIAYGESERSSLVFPTIVQAGVKHLQPIAGHISSINDWLEIAQLAQRYNLDFSSGGTSYFNSSFVAIAGKNAKLEFLKPILEPLSEIFIDKPKVDRGQFTMVDQPGIGLRVDWERLQKEDRITGYKVWD
ncbi:MAG: enolase C-terminal domain-like protein [Bacteroidota bacterium]